MVLHIYYLYYYLYDVVKLKLLCKGIYDFSACHVSWLLNVRLA